MDPLSIAFMGVGLATSIFGGMGQSDVAKQQAQVAKQQAALSADEAQQEMGINTQKQQAMELDANRRLMENFRNVQKTKAMNLAAATNQGAQFSSGFAGGQAGAQDQGNVNALGINQNLQIGRAIGVFNNNISQDRIKNAALGGQMADLQGQSAKYKAISNIGSTIMGSAGTFGNVAGAAGGFASKAAGLFSGGSLSGGQGDT